MSMIENARIINFKNDGDFISIRWLTESKKQIVSRYADENKDDFIRSLRDRNITSREQILNTTFSISIYESRGELKVRPDMMTANEIQAISVTSSPTVDSSKKTSPKATKTTPPSTVTPPTGSKSFTDKNWASKMGKIGAAKYQNTLALKRAQEPIAKLRDRIENLKFNCSPAFIETCNQFNSMLNAEIRNLEK
jgi:hypothetical protein